MNFDANKFLFLAVRAQGVAIGQDFLDFGWIESVPATEEEIFKDEYLLYQPGKVVQIIFCILT